jgi:hypothetical protein
MQDALNDIYLARAGRRDRWHFIEIGKIGLGMIWIAAACDVVPYSCTLLPFAGT